MPTEFKRVPAIEKCFGILDLLSKSNNPLGISEISRALNYNKSTVFNIVRTLTDMGSLENNNNKFHLGVKLYLLGRAAEKGSEVIRFIHPYLEEINRETHLTAFLGMRSGLRAMIIDKAESAFHLKISVEIGTRIPLVAGAHGLALLSQLSDPELTRILSQSELKSFSPFSCMDKKKYTEMVKMVREEKIAIEREEYVEGIRALAVPLNIHRADLQVAIWAVGLKNQIKNEVIDFYSRFLKDIAKRIENRFSL